MTGARFQGGSGIDISGHWHDSSLVLKGFGRRTLPVPVRTQEIIFWIKKC
jgi:hypothetical protein